MKEAIPIPESFILKLNNLLKPIFDEYEKTRFTIEECKNSSMYLTINFETSTYNEKQKMLESLMNSLKFTLSSNKIEVTQILMSGDRIERIRLDRKIIDGKLNWRSFIPYPEKLSQESIEILDSISDLDLIISKVESVQGDSLSKFTKYVQIAFNEGLITKQEKKDIEVQYHTVAHA